MLNLNSKIKFDSRNFERHKNTVQNNFKNDMQFVGQLPIELKPISFGKINALHYHKFMNKDKINILFGGTSDIEERNKKYPQDQKYRELLAAGIGLKPEQANKLSSILGTQELTEILKELKPENFSVGGKELKNVKNGIFKANLHSHTLNSDGKMSIQELLNYALDYADQMPKPPFIFAVTNHDTLDDTREAIKIIASDPEKYKNIRFVPGIELAAKHRNPKMYAPGSPGNLALQIELIGYCVNPFDKELNEYLEVYKKQNDAFAQDIIDKYNKYGINASLEEAKEFHNLIRISGSPAFVHGIKKYIQSKYKEKGWDWDDPKYDADKIFRDKANEMGGIYFTPATPEMKELLKQVKIGMLGLAHPGRVSLKHTGIDGKDAMRMLIDDLTSIGCKLIEYNYQYPDMNPGLSSWVEFINDYSAQKDLLKAGGVDNHGKSIFFRYN